ncbi:glycerol-3-phosphate acyltransferase, partial [Bacillus atrophaeus]
MLIALLIILAYLLGSIPSGLIVGKLAKGIDIREHGSGNLGATNAFRTLGVKAGSVVIAGDIL